MKPEYAIQGVAATILLLAWSSSAFCDEIHRAVLNRNIEKVEALIKRDPSVVFSKAKTDYGIPSGVTPLHYAVIATCPPTGPCGSSAEIVNLLLANKAEINAKDDNGATPLIWAAKERQIDIALVRLLLDNHADVNAKEKKGVPPYKDGLTALHYAISNYRKDVAELLLANNADANARANDGTTPLMGAADFSDTTLLSLLLENKADVNGKTDTGVTALHKAAYYGNKDVVQFLLAQKAEVNAKSTDGITPIIVAKVNGHEDVVRLLRQHGGRLPPAYSHTVFTPIR